MVRSLIDKLHDRHVRVERMRREAINREMLPPVECAPWCEKGDGHPNCFHESDQACWSPDEYVGLSLEPVIEEGDTIFPQQIGVMVRREPDTAGAVYLHLSDIPFQGISPSPYDFLDQSLNLTPDEAIRLGKALNREANLLQDSEGQR